MRSAVLTAFALVLAACTAAIGTQPIPSEVPQAPPTAPTAHINLDDMLAMYPQQTVFVATQEHVTAITLLNHFTRYQIPTMGVAEVSADSSGQWLYVLDADAAGSRRLRTLDIPAGVQRAALDGLTNVPDGGHALSVSADGRPLLLKADATHAWVDAYQTGTLQPLGTITQGPACSDRLLTSAPRIALVCNSTGELTINDLNGTSATVGAAVPDLVAAAMAADGTLYVATATERLATIAADAAELVDLDWPSEWSGTVLPDGLALVQGAVSVVIAESNADGAWLRVSAAGHVPQRSSFRLAGTPQGRILALWPFAYYSTGTTIRHIDLTSGLLETMTEAGADAAPAAIANG